MFATPTIVIEESIEQLLTLSRVLRAELGEGSDQPAILPPAARVLKEVLMTASVLISKLEVARGIHAEATWPLQGCIACED